MACESNLACYLLLESFIGHNHAHRSMCCFITASVLQCKGRIVETEIMWLVKSKIFAI